MTAYAEEVPGAGIRRWLIVVSTLTGTSVFLFSVTIVALATPYLQGTFSAAPDQIAWLGTSFLIGSTIVTACSGWLSTRFGRKEVFLAAIAGFTLFSVLGGVATSLEEIIVYRTFQGMFGAPLLPLGQAITVDAFPRHRQGFANIVFSIGTVMGIVLGPIGGGIVIEDYSWRWTFFAVVPIGVASWIGVLAFVPGVPRDADRRLDWFGFTAMVVALGAAMLALNRGQRENWFSSTEIVLEVAVAVVAAYVFIVHTATTARPFFEPALFRDRNFITGLLVITAWGGQIYLPTFLIPLQLQDLAGYPVTFVGVLLTARGLGNVAGSIAIARVMDRMDPRILVAVGVVFLAVAPWAMSNWTLEIRPWDVIWTGFLQGVGIGISFPPIAQLAFSTLDVRLRTEGMATFHLMLSIGAAAGIAIIFSVLANSAQINHEVLTGHISVYNEAFRYSFVPQALDLTEQSGLMAMKAEIRRQATMIAFNNSFYVSAVISALMLPMILFMRRPPTGRPEG